MPAIPHIFQGESLLLDPAGIIVWPRLAALAVADLHLEKGSACANQGQLVPPWDSALTLGRLAALAAHYAVTTIIAVGDSFHDDHAVSRLSTTDHATLKALTARARFVWVRGNHDPAPPHGLEGESTPAFTAHGLTFRHQARAGATGEISGHFHPKARVTTRAGDIVRPCFMADPNRMMLPSFGAYTGGLDVRSPAIARHFPNGGQAFLLGQGRIFCFSVPAPNRGIDRTDQPATALEPCASQPPTLAPKLVSAAVPHRFA